MCHQTISLIARYLEEHQIPTVIIGSALDIVEYCGVPRVLFNDFPLGNPCGKPYEKTMQADIILKALRLFETALTPRTIEKTSFVWDDNDWRSKYLEIRDEDRKRLLKLGQERREDRKRLRLEGKTRKE